jgi:hypothetical protein
MTINIWIPNQINMSSLIKLKIYPVKKNRITNFEMYEIFSLSKLSAMQPDNVNLHSDYFSFNNSIIWNALNHFLFKVEWIPTRLSRLFLWFYLLKCFKISEYIKYFFRASLSDNVTHSHCRIIHWNRSEFKW